MESDGVQYPGPDSLSPDTDRLFDDLDRLRVASGAVVVKTITGLVLLAFVYSATFFKLISYWHFIIFVATFNPVVFFFL